MELRFGDPGSGRNLSRVKDPDLGAKISTGSRISTPVYCIRSNGITGRYQPISYNIPVQVPYHTYMRAVVGVLDEPYSAKPAQRSSHTVYRPARLHRMKTVPAYVDWRACTATPLSGVS
jgi:hypothetical protein